MIDTAGIKRDPQAGVTLVEILVVLALLGVMTGAVALSLGGVGRAPNMTQEADLLVARLNRAVDEVVITSTPMRFQWQSGGYTFQSPDGSNWQPHPIPILGQVHDLPAGMTLESDGSTDTVVVDPNLIPTPRTATVLRLSNGSGADVAIRFDGANAAVMEDAL